MVDRSAHYCELTPTPFADVRLHRIDLNVARGDYVSLAALLSTDERERAGLYRQAEDRIRFVVTRAVLRLLLAEAGLGVAETLTIVAGPNGKPELLHSSPLRFNVAHSADVAVVALAEARPVGVDVELVRERVDVRDVANRFFALPEVAALARYDGFAHTVAFHRCWARKEACAKAAGLGLRAPLASLHVGVDPRREPSWRVALGDAPHAREIELADVDVRAGYAAAVAVLARPA